MRRRVQRSAGLLDLIGSIPICLFSKRKGHPTGGLSFWSRVRESNPTKNLVALRLFHFVAEFMAELILKS